MYVRTPIVVGLVVPGRTGEIIEIVAWLAVAVVVFLEIGLRTTSPGNNDGNDRGWW